ncbi:MAG TPA: signal peptide peptidase SppA, partial [Kofleriaceae bacterium]
EWLRPSRSRLSPDPGEPFRLTLGLAAPLGASAGFGIAWHHFHADGALSGLDAFDLGLSLRLGSYLAAGAALRDLATRDIAGTPVQRRYEAELGARPFGNDALDAGIGGRIGETRGDLDGWLRASLRVARGVYLQGEVETRALHAIEDTSLGPLDRTGRDVRATIGVELSFGELGATSLATMLRDDTGRSRALGGTAILRLSTSGAPSVLGTPDHIERVELSGAITQRQLSAHVVRLRAIARDSSARAMVVTLDGVAAGWAALEELRDEIARVRRAGKKVFAYMVSGSGRDYFVATAADKIYVDPAGGLRLVGMAGTTMYFRGAFEQVGVLPQFEKIAEYKSAPEQFTETGPTEAAARMRNELFDSLWDRWVAAVADARHLTSDQVIALVDRGPYTAGDLAADTRLVDAVAAPEKVSQLVIGEIGELLPVAAPAAERPERWQPPGVAVIYVDGDITDGKSQAVPLLGENLVGSETLIEALTQARSDPRIGAIILRIDSPGGSALASELIAREVFATRGVKPILCSMSNTAASGGYFIAAGCDAIFAEPMTITGSIGIFYGKFDIAGLARKLGVTTDTYTRGKHADLESMFRPYTDEERVTLKDNLRYMYGRFVGAVAEGRGLKPDAVDAVGGGHVWSGAQAMPIKLIDRFGGLADAIDEAKRRMGLAASDRIQLHELPDQPASLLAALGSLIGLSGDSARTLQLTDLPAVKQLFDGVPASVLVGQGQPQARLPFAITWQ